MEKIWTLLLNLVLSSTLACEPGDTCNFYSCLESHFPCGPEGYVVSFGGKYCQIFKDMSPSMSPLGQDWSRTTRKCLQKKLTPLMNGNMSLRDCTELRSFAFRTHPECYATSNWSLCELPVTDLWMLAKEMPVVALILEWSHTWTVFNHCAEYYVNKILF